MIAAGKSSIDPLIEVGRELAAIHQREAHRREIARWLSAVLGTTVCPPVA
jgi:hypothetical protein